MCTEKKPRSPICSKRGEGVPKSPWKPHKSKEDQFLLRNYTPKKFWAKKKSRKNPSKKNEKMSFLKNIIFFWVGFIFYFFESKKFFFSKLRFFQKWHFSKIFFFRMDFFDYFFRSEFFGGVVSKQKMVLFRFMGFSGRFRHSFTLFGANFGSGCNFTSYMGRLRTKEVFGLH